jgi:hypothetical protein
MLVKPERKWEDVKRAASLAHQCKVHEIQSWRGVECMTLMSGAVHYKTSAHVLNRPS